MRALGACDLEPVAPGLVRCVAQPPPSLPVFARDLLVIHETLDELPRGGRVKPIAQAIARLPSASMAIICLAADSDDGRKLAPLAKSIGNHLSASLGIPSVNASQNNAAYAVFASSDQVIIASPMLNLSNPWPGGIARLRMPHAAPSRSTLKLDEAFTLMLDPPQQKRWLKAGMRAVDLGAAPGGWTWQLVNRGMRVTAIDNGPMKGDLLDSGMVVHLRADGFTWRPKQRVDWLVCDMVAKPARVAERIAHWLNQGWCDRALFNLKLPMQRRYSSWVELHQQLNQLCQRPLQIRARHLYHDREEITVLAWSDSPPRTSAPTPAATKQVRKKARSAPKTTADANKKTQRKSSGSAKPRVAQSNRPGPKQRKRR